MPVNTQPIFMHLYFLDQTKTYYPLVLWMQAPRQKSVEVGSLLILEQAYQEVLSLDYKQGEVNLRHCPKSGQIMLVVSD